MASTSHDANGLLCEARGVSHDFVQPNGKPFAALRDISLVIHRREVVALLGPSGCGKSTLLRILAGLTTPTIGSVLFRGSTFTGINPGMALVFQSFALYPWMTVEDNIRTVLIAAGIAPVDISEKVDRAVTRVGLGGFEHAYPRELSGGMKQRVGVARAMALDPEMLFLDEPFCHVDALTAESLRAEVLDLWASPGGNPSSILLVSHDIPEVVAMADRIVLLGANPGRVLQIVDNPLPRPRNLRSPEAMAMIDRLHDLITGHEMPDVPLPIHPGTTTGATTEMATKIAGETASIPAVRTIQVLGLLEFLDARAGTDDLFAITDHTGQEFGQIIKVVKTAELLGCVQTPKRQVIITDAGRMLIRADHAARTGLWRIRILTIPLISTVVDLVRAQGEAGIDRDTVIETIILTLPQDDYEQTFMTIINWCRFAEMLTYDEARERVTIVNTPAVSPGEQQKQVRIRLTPYVDVARVVRFDGTPKKEELITKLADQMGRHPAITNIPEFTAAVLARERATTTGVGNGVALPHAQLGSVGDFLVSLGVISGGCDFSALDGKPVQVVAMIAAPVNDRPRYLRLLSAVAAQLNRPEVRAKMLAATDDAQTVAAFLS